MKKDIPIRKVENVLIAIVPPPDAEVQEMWAVFLINLKDEAIENVLISSRGYGSIDGQEVKTSVLRHFFEEVPGCSFVQVELIQPRVFSLNNEFWLSFSFDDFLYDRKFTFVSGSIDEQHFSQVPLIDRRGIMIGDV
ncbi:MAG: hypothetical protein OHK0039_25760 [Bacteroidia bacterium]